MASSRRTVSFSAVHPCFSFDNATDKTDNDGESSNSQDLERNGEEQRNQENSEIRKPEDIERMLSDDETLNKRLLSLRGSLKRRGSGSRVSRLVDSFKLTLVKFKESCHLSLKLWYWLLINIWLPFILRHFIRPRLIINVSIGNLLILVWRGSANLSPDQLMIPQNRKSRFKWKWIFYIELWDCDNGNVFWYYNFKCNY